MMFRRKQKRVKGVHTFGTEVCKALGLNASIVQKLTLTIEAGEVPRLDVVMYVKGMQDQKPALTRVLSTYRFTEVE